LPPAAGGDQSDAVAPGRRASGAIGAASGAREPVEAAPAIEDERVRDAQRAPPAADANNRTWIPAGSRDVGDGAGDLTAAGLTLSARYSAARLTPTTAAIAATVCCREAHISRATSSLAGS